MTMAKLRYGKYPAFVEALSTRYAVYNRTLDVISGMEDEEKAFVIRLSLIHIWYKRQPNRLRRGNR